MEVKPTSSSFLPYPLTTDAPNGNVWPFCSMAAQRESHHGESLSDRTAEFYVWCGLLKLKDEVTEQICKVPEEENSSSYLNHTIENHDLMCDPHELQQSIEVIMEQVTNEDDFTTIKKLKENARLRRRRGANSRR